VVLRWAQFPLLQGFCVAAFPQGGPPLGSDDPGTPSDGHWLGNTGSHTRDDKLSVSFFWQPGKR
jgi:hypothetical protein